MGVGGGETPHEFPNGFSPTPEDGETFGVLQKEGVGWIRSGLDAGRHTESVRYEGHNLLADVTM